MCFSPVLLTNTAVDYVIELEGRLCRIQVKKATVKHHSGSAYVAASTQGTRYNKYRERHEHAGKFDYYAFVCLELNTTWLVPQEDVRVVATWSKSVRKLDEISHYVF